MSFDFSLSSHSAPAIMRRFPRLVLCGTVRTSSRSSSCLRGECCSGASVETTTKCVTHLRGGSSVRYDKSCVLPSVNGCFFLFSGISLPSTVARCRPDMVPPQSACNGFYAHLGVQRNLIHGRFWVGRVLWFCWKTFEEQ